MCKFSLRGVVTLTPIKEVYGIEISTRIIIGLEDEEEVEITFSGRVWATNNQ